MICGIQLPAGLRESDPLPEPIFTPAAKINTGGHDENITYDTMESMIGSKHADALYDLSIDIYQTAAKYAASRGLILADTKFEFGLIDDTITLADEVLTPDSSRYWPAASYMPGWPAAQLRQTVCPRLSGIDPLEQAGAGAWTAGRGGYPYPGEVP